jgi:hypothetical protein
MNSANSDKVKQFIKEQIKLVQDGSKAKAEKANKCLVDPTKPTEEEPDNEYEYILTKKPSRKRVEKYLQGLIDAVVAENMD